MFGKRRLSRLFSRFKRSLNVVLLGSHFYSLLLRRSLETKEESWVLLLGLRFVTRIFISVLFWILVDLEDNPDFVDYIYIYI